MSIEIFYTEKGRQYCQGIGEDKPSIETETWIQLGQRVIRDLAKNTVFINRTITPLQPSLQLSKEVQKREVIRVVFVQKVAEKSSNKFFDWHIASVWPL